jgi:hypothetical protein
VDFLSGKMDSDVKVIAWMNHLYKFYRFTIICETKLSYFVQRVSDSLIPAAIASCGPTILISGF